MKKLWWILLPVLSLGVLLILWMANHSGAAQTTALPVDPSAVVATPAPASITSTTTSLLMLRIGLALAVVLVLIVAVVRGLRAMGWNRPVPQLGQIRVLDRCWLGPRKALYTVRIGERHVVVGVTEASIQPVLELSPQEGEALFPDADHSQTSPSFSAFLLSAARKVGGG